MTDAPAHLVRIIREETGLVGELVATIQRDQRRIVRRDVAALESSAREREGLGIRLQLLEERRRDACERILAGSGRSGDRPRGARLLAQLAHESPELATAVAALRASLSALREVLGSSPSFLAQSIHGLRELLGLVGSAPRPPAGPSSSGRVAADGTPAGFSTPAPRAR